MIVHYPQYDKIYFQQLATKLIENNFDTIEPFFPKRSSFFHEFVPLFIEINTCLIFECFFASITLTNHTLEKLLKSALVYNETGIKEVSIKDLNNHYRAAHQKYQGEDLYQTINRCCGKGLITKQHKRYLQDEVREQLRNGFSHSDPNKIIDHKTEKIAYMARDPKNPDKELTDLKLNPRLQSQIISSIVEKKAFPYYQNVVSISLHIQDMLIKKFEG
jgi:hypothetical protein